MTKVCILSSVHIALDNRVFYREARSLVKAGYEITLIAIHNRDEVKDDVQIFSLPEMPRWKRPLLWFELLKLALKQPVDIFHFHDPELLIVATWLRLLTGKPTIYDVHEVYPDFIKVKDYMPIWLRFPIAWIMKWLEPFLARFQSALIFSDEEIAKAFHKINKPKVILYNFPEGSFIEDGTRRTSKETSREPWVVHLGGHERNRGVHLMIEAFLKVIQYYPKARLLLVGHFMPLGLEDEVRNLINEKGLGDSVKITGRVPFEEIGDFLSKCSVGWIPWQDYPKNQKNIPTKLFEYMAYGLPVVSSDLRSTRPYVINGENGICVPPNDISSHAEAILHLMESPQKAMKMGLCGQKMVYDKWNWDNEENKLWSLYSQIIDLEA